MSALYILSDANGDVFHLQSNYIRYHNHILDASYIATITVKKNKVLFNNFKQNTTLPTLAIPFKTHDEARQVMDNCIYLYNLSKSNMLYEEDDERDEVFLGDAYGGSLQVTPEFLRYRDRIVGSNDVRTLHIKGRRVLINHFKANMNVPTMCVHFEDKAAAIAALTTIHSILWNVAEDQNQEQEQDEKQEREQEQDVKEDTEENPIESPLAVLDKPIDPVVLLTMCFFTLIFLTITRFVIGPVDTYEEL